MLILRSTFWRKKLDQTNLEMVKPKYRYMYSVTDYVDLEKSSMSQKFRRLLTIALLSSVVDNAHAFHLCNPSSTPVIDSGCM